MDLSFSLKTIIVIAASFIINGAIELTNANQDETFHNVSSLNESGTNYLQNETDMEWDENDSSAAPLVSMNLHQEMHLSDINGSSVVSSHYVAGEMTTSKPSKADTPISNDTALANYNGEISDSLRSKINPHWLKYPPQSPSAHYFLAFIYFIMMVFGIAGNAMVIFIYFTCSSVRTPANNLILNLAISDFLIMLEAPIFIYNSLHFGPAAGEFACSLYGLLGGAGGSGAIMTLGAISLDRYNVIVFPLNPSRSTTNMRSRLMILFIWLYTFPFYAIPTFEMFGVGGWVPEGYLTACSFDYLNTSDSNYWFIFSYAVAAYVVPMVTIAYCYFHILHVVVSAKKIQSSKEKNKTELRLAAIVMGIIGLWVFAWTPYAVVAMLGISGYGDSISPLASMIPAIMAKTAACVDPYLYAVTHPRFRAEIDKMFCPSRGSGNGQSRGTSRHQGDMESECETVQMEAENHDRKKRPLQRAESSFCEEESVVSEYVVDTKH